MPVGTVQSLGTAGFSDPIRLPAITAGAGSIAVAFTQSDGAPTGSVGGWTFYGSAVQSSWLSVYWKVTSASEGTSQWDGGVDCAAIQVYSGASTVQPIRTMGSAVAGFSNVVNVTINGSAGEYLQLASGIDSGVDGTPSASMTRTTNLPEAFRALMTAVEGTLTSTASVTRAGTWDGFNALRAVLLAIQPGDEPAPPATPTAFLTPMRGIL